MSAELDVLVAGGGPAGLSAALMLGRCNLQTFVCDGGMHRNRVSGAIHGLLGQDGRAPRNFLAEARSELEAYPSLSLGRAEIMTIQRSGTSFSFECSDGRNGQARRVLLATGLKDEVPEIPGLAPLYGRSVHHCLYCDAYEYSGRPLAAFGHGEKGAGLALMMRHWSEDVSLVTGGIDPEAETLSLLERHRVAVHRQPIARLEGQEGRMERIVLDDGRTLYCDALFFSTGCGQQSDLWQRLGCERDDKGGLISDPLTGETTSPGVYAAGDVSRDVLLVAVAIAEGAKAAVAIHRGLLRERGLL